MKQIEYPQAHRKGSLPLQEMRYEMRRGIDDWVRRLRSIEDTPAWGWIPLDGVQQRENNEPELNAQGPAPPLQSDEVGRWQDDGGECG